MESDFIEKLTATFSLFGKIAVDMGLVTEKQLNKAYIEQIEDNFANEPYRNMGKILLENGWITNEQIDIVLKELFKEGD